MLLIKGNRCPIDIEANGWADGAAMKWKIVSANQVELYFHLHFEPCQADKIV